MSDWRKEIDEEIEGFRALPRPVGRSFLGPDGRLDMDQVDEYFESQEEPERLGAKPARERRMRM